MKRSLLGLCLSASLIALLAVAAIASPSVVAAPASQAQACPDVAIYGVRGSGEDYLTSQYGMGPTVSVVADKLLHLLPAAKTILQVGNPYAAVSPDWAVLNSDGHGPYNDSVLQGAELLINGSGNFEGLHNLVKNCPQVDIVLIGLSQGAQVITEALYPANTPTTVTKRIKAIVLFGNPVRQSNTSYDVGTNANNGILSDPGLQPGKVDVSLPRFLWPETRSYCLLHDPICAFSAQDFTDHLVVHSTYGSSAYAAAGAKFAAGLLLGPPPPATVFPVLVTSAHASLNVGNVVWTVETKANFLTDDAPCLHLASVKPVGLVWYGICGPGAFGVTTHAPLPVGGGYAGKVFDTRPDLRTIVYRIPRSVFSRTVPRPFEIHWQIGSKSGTLNLP